MRTLVITERTFQVLCDNRMDARRIRSLTRREGLVYISFTCEEYTNEIIAWVERERRKAPTLLSVIEE